MILFGDPQPSLESLAQLAMAGDSVRLPLNVEPTLQATPSLFGGPAFSPWIALDIETANGRPEDAERHLRAHWSPPSNYKTAEAVGNAWLKYREEKTAKRALLDHAPVVVVTLRTPLMLHALHCLGAAPIAPCAVTGGGIEGFATAPEMLRALRNAMQLLVGPETVLVGHNIRGFDLTKLRWQYVRAGLQMPDALAGDQPVFDTMREYGKRFSMVEKPFVALADLLDEFGLPNHKGEMDGSKVPDFVERIQAGAPDAPKLLADLLAYALKDAAIEADLYLRMTGQQPDQQQAPGA